MLNNIFKGDITISKGYLRIPDKKFLEMLNSIEQSMVKSENEEVKE